MNIEHILSDEKLDDAQKNMIRSSYRIMTNLYDRRIEEKINILLRKNDKGNYIYSAAQMREVRKWLETYNKTFKEEEMEFCINPIFSCFQMKSLYHAMYNFEDKITIDKIKPFMIFKDNKLVFDEERLYQILVGIGQGLSQEVIELYARVDKELQPIFDRGQMRELRTTAIAHEPEDQIKILKILSTLNKDGKPFFSYDQILHLRVFTLGADDAQLNQLKDFIHENIPYEKFEPYVILPTPANHMRIYRSLISLGCPDDMLLVFNSFNPSYNELKEFKLYAQYIKELNIKKLFKLTFDDKKPNNIKGFLENVSEYIQTEIYSSVINSAANPEDTMFIIETCLEYEMPLNEINFIINSGFKFEEMKYISIALLNGANFERIKEDHLLAKKILNDEAISEDIKKDFDYLDLDERG